MAKEHWIIGNLILSFKLLTMKRQIFRSYLFSAIVAFTLFSSTFVTPCKAQWVDVADLPSTLALMEPAVLDGKVYLFGGLFNETSFESSNSIYVYDPVTDEWIIKGQMPAYLDGIVVEEYNGKFYLFGGHDHPQFNVRREVMVYDPVTEVFDTVSQMPSQRVWFATCVLNGKIYVMGGNDPSFTAHSTVDIYDPVTNTWQIGPPLSAPRGALAADTLDGKIYVSGGSATLTSGLYNTMEVYDPASGWEIAPALMPTLRAFHSSRTIGGRLYVFGGSNSLDGVLNSVEYFEPVSGVWVEDVPMNHGRREFGLALVNGHVAYLIGGVGVNDENELAVIDKVEKNAMLVGTEENADNFDPKLSVSPNPAVGTATISYQLEAAGQLQLTIYDMQGHSVRSLRNGWHAAGAYSVDFHRDHLPKGAYLAVLQFGNGQERKAWLLVQ